MRVLMVSTDRKILETDSPVSQRMMEYGGLFDELHIVVFAEASLGLQNMQLGNNVWLYPTNSISRWTYVFDAKRIGRNILSKVFFGQTAITAQDPFETGMVGVSLKRFAKVPLQVQIHTDAWSSYFQYGGFLNWVRVTLIAPFILRRADGIRVVSEKIRRDAVVHAKVDPRIVTVLPIAIDVSRYQSGSVVNDIHTKYPQWKTIVLMASRLSHEKNILSALNVWRAVVKHHPDAGLVIVGSGPREGLLKQQTERWKLTKNVAFEDWQNNIVSYFRSADIFLNTSLYEGFGMTLVEAGVSGTAIVTSLVGIAHDWLEDGRNASVCPVGDSACIRTKLVTLIENPHMRKSFGALAKEDIGTKVLSKEEYLQNFKAGFDALFAHNS